MQEFLQEIDNKDVLEKILNNSVDFLIGNRDENYTRILCKNLGINKNPDDFVRITKSIAQNYRSCWCNDSTEGEALIAELFPDIKSELQPLVGLVYKNRRSEFLQFLLREHNAQEYPLVETFDYDLRYIMGDSSSPDNKRLIVVVTLYCRQANGQLKNIQFQADEQKLDKFISELEKAYKLLTE